VVSLPSFVRRAQHAAIAAISSFRCNKTAAVLDMVDTVEHMVDQCVAVRRTFPPAPRPPVLTSLRPDDTCERLKVTLTYPGDVACCSYAPYTGRGRPGRALDGDPPRAAF
jgi:hypothetical protein